MKCEHWKKSDYPELCTCDCNGKLSDMVKLTSPITIFKAQFLDFAGDDFVFGDVILWLIGTKEGNDCLKHINNIVRNQDAKI